MHTALVSITPMANTPLRSVAEYRPSKLLAVSFSVIILSSAIRRNGMLPMLVCRCTCKESGTTGTAGGFGGGGSPWDLMTSNTEAVTASTSSASLKGLCRMKSAPLLMASASKVGDFSVVTKPTRTL